MANVLDIGVAQAEAAFSEGHVPPLPTTPPPPPGWSPEEEASLRTLVGELGDGREAFEPIAERLGTGRTGGAVRDKWRRMCNKRPPPPPPPPREPSRRTKKRS